MNDSRISNLISRLVFILSLVIYWITADRHASYWDCPEYITTASALEVGHPPGNPIWTLAMRVVTIPFPPDLHPFIINLFSGIFMALASGFLAWIAYFFLRKLRVDQTLSGIAALGGALCFSYCDSAWFSAVEAEVYAFSAFLTSFSIYIMLKWSETADKGKRVRLLLLTAYLTGLSLGVHQLNLLCIPVYVLIWLFDRYKVSVPAWKITVALLFSFALVGCILVGLMPGSLSWAAEFELTAVNSWGLPYQSGVIIYVTLLLILFGLLPILLQRSPKPVLFLLLFFCLSFSGIFLFRNSIIFGFFISAGVTIILYAVKDITRSTALNIIRSLGFILLGYSAFFLILTSAQANPYLNTGNPDNIFALKSYIEREQYGSHHLFYGPTPYSKPILKETFAPDDSVPTYTKYLLETTSPQYAKYIPEARLYSRSGILETDDSTENQRLINRGRDAYLLKDYSFRQVLTPELNMFFPRITESSNLDLAAYSDWTGMDTTNMSHVRISEVIDTAGNFTNRKLSTGSREEKWSYRPTYLQNLQYFLTYQVGYMYFRYLFWNFIGRQNDFPAGGEIDNGNFMTGIPPVDKLMVGDYELMPDYASDSNKGRNIYYGIPFIWGIVGLFFLLSCKNTGQRIFLLTGIFFLMTGVAIVVYLNQSPGEPRERDYSFLGSYMAFAIWISLGIAGIGRWIYQFSHNHNIGRFISSLIAVFQVALMFAVNFDDHDRRFRNHPEEYACYILAPEDPTIIFSYGDNYTFPLWYTREAGGVGKQHTIIDVSYLATPDYVVHQMNSGLKTIAKPADIAYGAYSFTYIPYTTDSTPVPLEEELTHLYSRQEGSPEFCHSKVILPGVGPESDRILSLRELSAGSSMLSFKQLMLLDILAANMTPENPQKILFLYSLPRAFYKGLEPFTRVGLYGKIFERDTTASYPRLKKELSEPLKGLSEPRKPERYLDPLLADMKMRQRARFILAARESLNAKDSTTLYNIIGMIDKNLPYSLIPYGHINVADTNFNEGLEFARLLHATSKQYNDNALKEKAVQLLSDMEEEAGDWQTYYQALPPERRNAVSAERIRRISDIKKIKNEKKNISDGLHGQR